MIVRGKPNFRLIESEPYRIGSFHYHRCYWIVRIGRIVSGILNSDAGIAIGKVSVVVSEIRNVARQRIKCNW